MPVTFVAGSAAKLRNALRDQTHAALVEDSARDVVIVVPSQLTLDTERLALGGLPGSFRLQVYSLGRMCEAILARTGGTDLPRISETGRAMLMRRILDARTEPLHAFERARKTPAFAFLAAADLAEWKEAGCTPEDIRALAQNVEGTPLGQKLTDIAELSEAWQQAAAPLGLDGDDLRTAALRKLPESGLFRDADIWFYGNDLITVPVAQAISALEKVAREVRVLVPPLKDPDAGDAHLYGPMRMTCERLEQMLSSSVAVRWEQAAPVTAQAEPLHTLSETLYSHTAPLREDAPECITLFAAKDPLDEAMHTAALIRSTVRKRGWRYRDIAIACEDPDNMYGPLRRACALYEVPVFFPEGRVALHHPLCATLVSALSIATGAVTEGDVQCLLSMGYAVPDPEQADFARVFAIEHGISGRRWLRGWKPSAEDDEQGIRFESVRSACLEPVRRLTASLRTGNTRSRLEAVCTYLDEIGAYDLMQRQSDMLAAGNELTRAAEGSQVWTRLNSCLDEIALLYGEAETPDASALRDLLRQALSGTELKPLPQSADAVSAGSLEHMKTRPVRLLLITGAVDTETGSTGALLTDRERESIADRVWLGPDRLERTRMRMLATRGALSFAQEELHVSWHLSSTEGSVTRPGMLVRSIRSIWPSLPVQGGVLGAGADEDRMRLMQPDAALLRGSRALREEGGPDRDTRDALHAALLGDRRTQAESLRGALLDDVMPARISPSRAVRLYEGPERLSVTRLEMFAECPFRHFIRYGAKPKEIREYGFIPSVSGDLCHRALERFVTEAPDETDVTAAVEHMGAITDDLLSGLFPHMDPDDHVLRAEAEALRRKTLCAAETCLRQLGLSRFRPKAAEAAFGKEQELVPLDGASLFGRIDRIDVWENEGRKFLRVTDYKSGNRTLSLPEIYYGLQLQLIIYLIAAGAMENAEYAAALYFHIDAPLADVTDAAPCPEDPEKFREQNEMQIRKELRPNGLLLQDVEVLKALSDPVEEGLRVSITKSGEPKKSNSLVTPDAFAALARHALKCAQKDLDAIRAGDIAARPSVLKDKNPCDHCLFRSVCRQDPYTDAARRADLPSVKPEEALARMLNGE